MRALAHVNRAPVPDYRLRVPPGLQAAVALGLLGGFAGIALVLGEPAIPRIYSVLLITVGIAGGLLGGALWIITSQHLRVHARRRMLQAVAWRGDERVLDVGCGNGFLLVEIAKQLTTGNVTGIDLWKAEAGAQSSEVAWRNAHIERVQDRIDIQNVDARAMPFADHAFDVIVSSLMLHHSGGGADRDRVIDEMLRALKPGGTILLYDARPLISAATRRLGASRLSFIERTGSIMTLLVARSSAVTPDKPRPEA